MTPLYVRSKVCMAPFHVRSKVCNAPIHVQSKVCKLALHMDGSIANFAPHMEGSHADLAPRIKRRHSFRYQMIAKTASFANLHRELFKTTNILGVSMTYVTTFDSQNVLRESTFKTSQVSILRKPFAAKLEIVLQVWIVVKGNYVVRRSLGVWESTGITCHKAKWLPTLNYLDQKPHSCPWSVLIFQLCFQ